MLNRSVLSLDLKVTTVGAHLISTGSWFQLQLTYIVAKNRLSFRALSEPMVFLADVILMMIYSVSTYAIYEVLGH